MKHDIHSLGTWLEKVCQEGVAIERKILDWKLAEEGGKAVETGQSQLGADMYGAFLIEARSDAWALERSLDEADGLRLESEAAAAASDLPEAVDVQAISKLLAEVHLAAWGV